ncbi:restriction endonuclease subunit S [Flavobacterium tegetincola]|uniref:restriction endonuclease subunit S n=1 Tax=Flavobacterium tegetincola TaxID=150172 RepID=UPI0004102EB4|nr:restriction endonuclease subunit S [Flavobacterium tegetincola]
METVIKKLQSYAKYKPSGVEWLGEIPEDWEIKKLKHLGNIFPGLNGKKGDDFSKEFSEGIKSFIPFTNICNNHIISNEQFQYVKVKESENQNRVKKNDILFLMSSETLEDIAKNSIYLGDAKELYLNSFCKGFRINSVKIYPQFINYLISSTSYRKYFSLVGRGFTRINIKQEFINDATVVFPNLNEQTAIAKFLDDKTTKIDQAISIKQQQIELLKERRQILIHKAVTQGINPDVKLKDSGVEWIGMIPESWEVKRLASFGKFSKGGGFSKADLVEDGLQCILYGDIYTRYDIQITAVKRFIDNNKIKTSILLNVDDLLFTGSGETKEDIGKCVVFKNKVTTVAGGDVIIFKQKENHSLYLSYVLNTEGAKSEKARYSKGEIIVHTYGSKLRNIYVPIPPLSEQKEISAYIENATNKIATAISLKEQEIEKLKEYKSSLIDGVVTGKVKIN